MRLNKPLSIVCVTAVLALSSTAACFAQADTEASFVTWEHQGSDVQARFLVRCGEAAYSLQGDHEAWVLERDDAQISASVDAFLTHTLNYFDRVSLTALNCGNFGGPGITEGLSFAVVKRFEDDQGVALQYGRYTVLLSEDDVIQHFFSMPASGHRPQPRIIDDFFAFARERGLEDVPGVKPYWPDP